MEDEKTFWEEFIKAYQLNPIKVQAMGKITKIETQEGTMALKKRPIHKGMDFVQFQQILFQKGFFQTVPIYSTVDGRYGVAYGSSLYYLMPWVTDEAPFQDDPYASLFREWGRMHFLSSQTENNSEDDYDLEVKLFEEQMTHMKEMLDSYMDHCESIFYLSPFQWLYVDSFTLFKRSILFAESILSKYTEGLKENNQIRSVIVHGDVSLEHYLFKEKGTGYFINFEKAKRGKSVEDLSNFFNKLALGYPKPFGQIGHWMKEYERYNPLTQNEWQSLYINLSFQYKWLGTFETKIKELSYSKSKQALSHLQRGVWKMRNLEKIVMEIQQYQDTPIV
jgi:spore coat protein YsxE